MIITQLILAHLLGDFILQPTSWVKDKEVRKGRSPYFAVHILLHFVLAWVCLWDLKLWWIAAIIAVTHALIDWCKLNFQNVKTKRAWFIWDQIAHLLVILAVGLGYQYFEYSYTFSIQKYIPIITGALFLTIPSSIIIKNLITYWTPMNQPETDMETDSLANAGKYIGILERLLVFAFIVVDHWEGVGFMIAAKSVFRFSDLAQAKQRKLTEYVLIGTLLSFGIAIITGILVK